MSIHDDLIWRDEEMAAADLETSGHDPDFALQPWRMAQGDMWITSASMMRADPTKGFVPVLSQLFPRKEQIIAMLERVIFNGWTIVGWNLAFDISCLMALGPEIADMCMRIKWLDGMLIERHFDIEPEYEFQSNKSKKKSYSLKGYTDTDGTLKPGAMQRWLPNVPLHNENVDFHSVEPGNLARLQKYNDGDNVYTFIIARMIWMKLTVRQRRDVLIQCECLPVVAQGNLLGLVVDQLTAKHLGVKLEMAAAARLFELAPDGMREDIVRSPLKLAELMFDQWKLPVLKENKSKVEGKANSRSTDKEVLHELSFIDPRASKVKAYREALNAKGKFPDAVLESVRYNGNGRTHPLSRLGGTYCVPGDVEVLTRAGWVALHDWEGGLIAQVHADQRIEFLPADRFVGPVTDEWVRIDHRRLQCDFTPGHKMPYLTLADEWRQMHAGEWTRGMVRDLPVAGRVELGGSLSPEQMRVLAMVQADGHFRPRGGALTFCFEKRRKIERVRAVLRAAGISQWRESGSDARPDRVEFYVSARRLPAWLAPDCKVFGPWVLDTTTEGLTAFVDELVHWDGTPHPDGGVRYGSQVRENVEWVVTAAALIGRKASLHAPYTNGMHGCHISEERAVISVRGDRHITRVGQDQRAYCATTQTGFWLARSKGHIFVTGNTDRMTVASKQGRGSKAVQTGFALHQMMRGADVREIITVEDDCDIVEFDAAGQEFRWMAVAANDATMLTLCQPGEDAHTYMGAAIVGMPYQAMLLKVQAQDKTAGDNRYLGKFANLSLQYRTSARKLRSKARVDYNIPLEMPAAHRIHATYPREYPGVPAYWEHQIALVKALGYVETFGGSRIQVTGDWNGQYGWSMGSTAINARIQGTGANQKHLAIAVIKDYLREIGGRFMFDLHDGLYLAIPKAIRPKAVDVMKQMLDNLPYQKAWGFTPPIPMPWDCKTGPAWGRLTEVKFA